MKPLRLARVGDEKVEHFIALEAIKRGDIVVIETTDESEEKSACCEKCLKCPDYPHHKYCHDKECECHSPVDIMSADKGEYPPISNRDYSLKITGNKGEDWEKDFDKLLIELQGQSGFSSYVGSFHCAKLKDFIRSLHSKWKESLVEAGQKLKKQDSYSVRVLRLMNGSDWEDRGYNKAINDIIHLINSK